MSSLQIDYALKKKRKQKPFDRNFRIKKDLILYFLFVLFVEHD